VNLEHNLNIAALTLMLCAMCDDPDWTSHVHVIIPMRKDHRAIGPITNHHHAKYITLSELFNFYVYTSIYMCTVHLVFMSRTWTLVFVEDYGGLLVFTVLNLEVGLPLLIINFVGDG
jgi:hypothetical protein